MDSFKFSALDFSSQLRAMRLYSDELLASADDAALAGYLRQETLYELETNRRQAPSIPLLPLFYRLFDENADYRFNLHGERIA